MACLILSSSCARIAGQTSKASTERDAKTRIRYFIGLVRRGYAQETHGQACVLGLALRSMGSLAKAANRVLPRQRSRKAGLCRPGLARRWCMPKQSFPADALSKNMGIIGHICNPVRG